MHDKKFNAGLVFLGLFLIGLLVSVSGTVVWVRLQRAMSLKLPQTPVEVTGPLAEEVIKSCSLLGRVAQATAVARDAGVPVEEIIETIDRANKDREVSTGFAALIYHEWSHLSPDNVRFMMIGKCIWGYYTRHTKESAPE